MFYSPYFCVLSEYQDPKSIRYLPKTYTDKIYGNMNFTSQNILVREKKKQGKKKCKNALNNYLICIFRSKASV